ncbi:unnamed protein product, partial [Ectocarpus sp. 12 AP-2014]
SLYGSLKDSRQPLKPYLWSLDRGALMEIPVTTLPLLRLPFHGTYLNYLADFSPALARSYFAVALRVCRLRGVAPSFLLHASDFLGADDPISLEYLPGMKRSADQKNEFMMQLLKPYSDVFRVCTIGAYVDELKHAQTLPRLVPVFES